MRNNNNNPVGSSSMAELPFSFSWFIVGKLHLKFQVLHGDILERTQAGQETWSDVFRLYEV